MHGDGHTHRVEPLVHVHGGAGDSAGERAGEKGGRVTDFGGGEFFGQRRVGGAVFHHLVDDADGTRRARRKWTGADRVHAQAVLATGLEREHAGVALECGLGRRHAAAVAGNGAFTGHVRERADRAARAHKRREALHHGDERKGTRAGGGEIAGATDFEQRLLHFGPVGQRVKDDVERLVAEVGRDALREAADGEVADVLVALRFAHVAGRIAERVVHGVEGIDALEGEQRSIAQATGCIHLPAFEQVEKNVEGRRPCGHTHRGTGLGEGLRDGEAEAAVVGDARHEGALAGKIDG